MEFMVATIIAAIITLFLTQILFSSQPRKSYILDADQKKKKPSSPRLQPSVEERQDEEERQSTAEEAIAIAIATDDFAGNQEEQEQESQAESSPVELPQAESSPVELPQAESSPVESAVEPPKVIKPQSPPFKASPTRAFKTPPTLSQKTLPPRPTPLSPVSPTKTSPSRSTKTPPVAPAKTPAPRPNKIAPTSPTKTSPSRSTKTPPVAPTKTPAPRPQTQDRIVEPSPLKPTITFIDLPTQPPRLSYREQEVIWREIKTYTPTSAPAKKAKKNKVIWDEIKTSAPINYTQVEINQSLADLVGQKDRVSGEILKSGEKVYVCLKCQLGYHEDSWHYLNRMCEQCKADEQEVKAHILPNLPQSNQILAKQRQTDMVQFTSPQKQVIEKKNYSFQKSIES